MSRMNNYLPYSRTSERGNVLVYILIAVALIASLSYAVTRSGTGGDVTQISEERAKIHATDIIEYTNILASGVGQLRLRACKISQMSFEDPEIPGYTNGDTPSDGSCKIFSLSGAGVTYTAPPFDAVDTSKSPDRLWHFYSNNEIQDVGTTCGSSSCSEILAVVDELSRSVCIKLNELLGIANPSGNPPTDSEINTTKFTGSFGFSETIGDEVADSPLMTRRAACFEKTSGTSEYVFYKVLYVQ